MALPSKLAIAVVKCDTECIALARLGFGEARGWPSTDDAACMWTALNRKAQNPKRYGRTINEVCLRRYAYSCFGDGGHLPAVLHPEHAEPKAWAKMQALAAGVLAGKVPDETAGATHYVAKWLYDSPKCPGWARAPGVVALQLGPHVFLKGRAL